MKKLKKPFTGLILTVLMPVLMLSGMFPAGSICAAYAAENQMVPAATYDDSRVPAVKASSAVLMDAGSGEIIYEKNADEIREPASITKMLNLMVVLEELDMDRILTVPYDIESVGTIIELKAEEKISVKDLIYGMMLESGNDAAELLAEVAGGDLDTFSDMMNSKARECGAKNTDFKNPNGLNDDKNRLNYCTAMDLALIAREGMKDPEFREIVGTARYTIKETNKHKTRKLYNSNYCLWNEKGTVEVNGEKVPVKYRGCNGIKTGMTSSAGACLVASAKRGNTELIVVIMNSESQASRFADAMTLWDYGFANYKTYTAAKADSFIYEQKVKRGSLAEVDLKIKEDFDITVNRDYKAKDKISTKVELDQMKPAAPIKKGQAMGTLVARNDKGSVVGETVLYASQEVRKGGLLSYIGIADEELPVFFAITGAVLALLIVILLMRRKGRHGRKPPRKGRKSPRRGRKPPDRSRQSVSDQPADHYEEPAPQQYEPIEQAPWSSFVMQKNATLREQRRPPLASVKNVAAEVETEAEIRNPGRRSSKQASESASRRVRNKRRKRRVMKRSDKRNRKDKQ